MAAQSTAQQESLVDLPSNPHGYVAIIAVIVTAVIHLMLGQRVMGFSQMLGILFILNGLGYLGGLALYLTRYWRRELYLVAAAYAIVTIIAFFAFQGPSVDAFYQRGSLNPFAVIAKAVEVILAVVTLYLYSETSG